MVDRPDIEVRDGLGVGELERAGRLREALRQARALALDARVSSVERRRAALDRARLAFRLGRAREAHAALRPLSHAHAETTDLERIEVLLLRAAMALERGAGTRAKSLLAAARARAEESGDDESLARVLRRLGTLEARRGRPLAAAGAYRAALAALARVGRASDVTLEDVLRANLATMEAWLGHHDAAEQLYRAALAERADRPSDALNTRAALALLEAARGRRSPGGDFEPLVAEAERLGEPRLRVELAVYRAEELVFLGALADADAHLGAARVALADLGGSDVILEALVEITTGLARARRGERAAPAAMLRSVARLERAGAVYHAARAARSVALARVWLGADDASLDPLDLAARLAGPPGIVLGDALTHVVPLALAATRGSDPGRSFALESLDRVGPTRVEAALRREGRPELVRALHAHGLPAPVGAPFRALGPEGARALTHVEREALHGAADAVILDRTTSELVLPGRRPRSLARMRSVEPLLAHLIARRPDAVPLEELARVVWEQRLSPSVRAAITTSVTRARHLLGRAATIRVQGAGERRAYVLEVRAPLWLVEARA